MGYMELSTGTTVIIAIICMSEHVSSKYDSNSNFDSSNSNNSNNNDLCTSK